jgi:hypothetical protein
VILSDTCSKYHSDRGQVFHAAWTECSLLASAAVMAVKLALKLVYLELRANFRLSFEESMNETTLEVILYICILSHIAISLPLVFSVFCAAY